MAFPAAPTERARRMAHGAALQWRRFLAAVDAYPVERIGLAVIAAGVVLRLLTPLIMDFRSDGNTYVAMGHAWMLHHEFLMPYGDVSTWGPTPPGHSNHYPPAYPFYLGVVFTLFGYGVWQAKLAAVFVSLAALAAVYWTTRDLFGRQRAALMTGLLAVEPHLIWVTGTGFSENMVLFFFALTMWAILKSLEDDRWVVLAGLFAGFAYMSRASVGYFFVIAGLGGFFWRFAYRRWRLFTNVWYMLAIVVFGGIVFSWATRNVMLFGWTTETVAFMGREFTFAMPLWETSSYTRWVQNYAFERPNLWRYALIMKAPLFLAFVAWYVVPFLPEMRRGAARVREEATSALVLSVTLVFVIAWAISSMFWVFEQSWIYWFDNHRYVVIGLLPLGWFALREARLRGAGFRLRYAALAVSLFVATAGVVTSPVKFSDIRAAEFLDEYLEPGDEIMLGGGTIKYAFYSYLSDPTSIEVYGYPASGRTPEWILTLEDKDWPEGYVLVGEWKQTFWNGGVMSAKVYGLEEVVADRGVPTGIEDHGVSTFRLVK